MEKVIDSEKFKTCQPITVYVPYLDPDSCQQIPYKKRLLEDSEYGVHAELFKELLQFCVHVVMVL